MSRRPLIVLSVTLVVAALGVAGCGSSSSSSSSSAPSTPTATTKQTPATGGKAASGGVQVNMKNIQFVPANITAKVGQKIMWTNTDSVAHTVTAQNGATFDSGTLDVGKSFSFTPTKAGKINYACMIHPNQTGTITVR